MSILIRLKPSHPPAKYEQGDKEIRWEARISFIFKHIEKFQKSNVSCSPIPTIPNTSPDSELANLNRKEQRIRKPVLVPALVLTSSATWGRYCTLWSPPDGHSTSISPLTRGVATVRFSRSNMNAFWKYTMQGIYPVGLVHLNCMRSRREGED